MRDQNGGVEAYEARNLGERTPRRLVTLLAGQLSFVATQLAFSVILARQLGPTGRGAVAVVVATGSVIGFVFEYGGELRATAESGRGVGLGRLALDPRLLANAGFAALATFAIVEAGSGATSIAPTVVGLYAVSVAASVVVRQYLGWLVGRRRVLLAASLRWCLSGISLAILACLTFTTTVTPALGIAAISAGILVVLCVAGFSIVTNDESVEHAARQPARQALNIQVGQMGLIAIQRLDQITLGFLGYVQPLGLYAAAVNITDSVQYLPTAAASLIAGRTDGRSIKRLRAAVMVVTIGLAFVVGFLAEPVITLVYGASFSAAARYVPSLLVGSLVFSFVRLQWADCVRQTNTGAFARAGIGAFALGAPLVLAGIAIGGALGAAYGSAVAFVIAALLLQRAVTPAQDRR